MHASAGIAALEFRDVVKDFAVGLRGLRLRAVDHLSLRVEVGRVYGLLGPNGSGKSTAFKLLLGLQVPTAGACRLFGSPVSNPQVRRWVGYLPESPVFPPYLTGHELVVFHARLAGLGGRELAARTDGILELVGLQAAAGQRIRTYSKGMLQRLGLAQALVHDPRLLILDEPTAGVDPLGSVMLCELITSLRAMGKTVVLTSHLPAELEQVCDTVGIMDRGRLKFEGVVDDLEPAGEPPVLGVEGLSPDEAGELAGWLAARGRVLREVGPRRDRLARIYFQQVARRIDP